MLASGTPTGVATPGGGLALYGGLGAPKANRANPGGAGNAEGNWWTPSYVLDTDCDGNRVTPTTKLSQECIYKKKTEEIKQKQAINALNAEYKVEKLAQLETECASLRARERELDAQVEAFEARLLLLRTEAKSVEAAIEASKADRQATERRLQAAEAERAQIAKARDAQRAV